MLVAARSAADTLHLDARELFARSVATSLRLSNDGKAIQLGRDELLEDDGPAAGYSYKPNEEKLSATTWIKKDFVIADPRMQKATLLVGPGGALQAMINGRPVTLHNPTKTGQYWQAFDIPTDVWKAGRNEVILHGSGKVWIARADEFAAGSLVRPRHPKHSAKSTDAGKSWQRDCLGPAGSIEGEYYIRLLLDRYRAQGTLTSPVLDAANFSDHPVGSPITALGKVRIRAIGDGTFLLRVRTGSTFVPDVRHWTGWHDLDETGTLERTSGRYIQLAVTLRSDNPLQTPSLKQITIEANPDRPVDWTKRIRVIQSQNPEIQRSSIPFAYERFDHPRLKKLRADFKLDDVVRGAKTDFEKITRLAAWSARQFQRGHLRDAYPPWDALEILKPHADKTPVGGFCQQYNIVFLQACESFGFVGRAVSLGAGDHGAKIRSGHEVVEIWSNDHGKWIYVDGQLARYHIDEKSGVPLSLWELRERQVALFRGKTPPAVKAIQIADTEPWQGLTGFPPFFEMRLIPRSNFLEQKSPLPLNQGMRGWFWTGHYVWTDPDYPASKLYRNRITNRRDWEWPLNQTHCKLEATETAGVLRVHLDTETPGFDTFVGDIDGAGKRPIATSFLWRLHAGRNSLEIRSRNRAGSEGPPARLVLNFAN